MEKKEHNQCRIVSYMFNKVSRKRLIHYKLVSHHYQLRNQCEVNLFTDRKHAIWLRLMPESVLFRSISGISTYPKA